MSKTRIWMVGLTIVALLAAGVAVMAGNGFGAGSNETAAQAVCTGDVNERDADGDGICNSEDSDWTAPQDGTGYGVGQGIGGRQQGDRPRDGTGYGAGLGNRGQQLRDGAGSGNQHGRGMGAGDGTCL